MLIVMKFGGSSLEKAAGIQQAAKIIAEQAEKNDVVVVVSALDDITDKLIAGAKKILQVSGGEKKIQREARKFVMDLSNQHKTVARQAITNEEVLGSVFNELQNLTSELERILTGIAYLGELTPRSLDSVMSFGERMAAPIIADTIKSLGASAKHLTGQEAGIVTDSNFGRANPLMDITKKNVKKKISPLLKKKIIPVVTGFIATNEDGVITTLGRGGSDYTASIIGTSLHADEIWIWTDVDGIMTSDPKIVADACTIPVLSYAEATELAYFGARILHPKTIEPATEAGIPVRVKNTFNPQSPGTLIVKEEEKTKEVVKAITTIQDVALINIAGAGMIDAPSVANRVFQALSGENVNVIMISQASSEANMSLLVDENDLPAAFNTLKNEFVARSNVVRDITYDKNVCAIAVVGAGMRGTIGVAARVFNSVAQAKVNIIMISQGSSELNISFVVSAKDAPRAVQALHKEFSLGS